MISFWEDNLPNFKYQKNWPSDSHLNPILYWLFKFLYFYQSHSTRNVKVLEHHFIIPRILRGLWISVTSPAKVSKFKRNPWRSGNELIQIGEAYPNQKPSFWLILAFQFPIIITQWWLFENDFQPLVSINTNWPFSSRWRWRWDFQATLASSETRPLPIQGGLSPIIHDHPYKHGLITTSWSS